MRLTCLKCGHQVELAADEPGIQMSCICGQDYQNPQVYNTGICPNERAAERSRSRAFRAAGLVKNVGGFALGVAALGVLFFPLGLLGAAIGLYVLTMLRGPVGRYSGRRAAAAAVALGVFAFGVEGALTLKWIEARRLRELVSIQDGASEDLRTLLRAERLFRATSDTYGTFSEIGFAPRNGQYTLYLGPEEYLPASRNGVTVRDPLPEGLQPGVGEQAFTAVAVGDLDSDAALDVWTMTDGGRLTHVTDDLAD